jgi:hypothetical protein
LNALLWEPIFAKGEYCIVTSALMFRFFSIWYDRVAVYEASETDASPYVPYDMLNVWFMEKFLGLINPRIKLFDFSLVFVS